MGYLLIILFFALLGFGSLGICYVHAYDLMTNRITEEEYEKYGFIPAFVFVTSLILMTIMLFITAGIYISAFWQVSNYIEVFNSGTTNLEIIQEYNEWLAAARDSKAEHGLFSRFYFTDLHNFHILPKP